MYDIDDGSAGGNHRCPVCRGRARCARRHEHVAGGTRYHGAGHDDSGRVDDDDHTD